MFPGKYTARATDVALGMTETGKEQIAVSFEVVDGDQAGEEITWYGYFTEKTAERTIESLRHMGWQGNDLAAIAVDQLPNEVSIVVDADEYNGVTRMKVQWVNRAGAGLALRTRMAPDAASSFAARMKGLCMSVKADAPQVPRPRNPAPPQSGPGEQHGGPEEGEDIPF